MPKTDSPLPGFLIHIIITKSQFSRFYGHSLYSSLLASSHLDPKHL
jgi:hypothetical protein